MFHITLHDQAAQVVVRETRLAEARDFYRESPDIELKLVGIRPCLQK